MPNRSFNFDGIFPSWVQRLINIWQRFGPMAKWVLKYAGLILLGYLLHVVLCACKFIKPAAVPNVETRIADLKSKREAS